MHKTISSEDAGGELRAVAREERPTVVLKAWEQHDLMEAVNSNLAKRHPDYDAITRLMKVREDMFTAGFRPAPGDSDALGDSGPAERSRAGRGFVKSRLSFRGIGYGFGFRPGS